ncbi:MAG: hybrid sensor histidine kinase/response regulator [Cyanobacteria bacterium P01_D01_bin.71]
MTSEPSPFKQTHPYFLQEAAELLQQIDDGLQILRQDFSVNQVHTLMRVAHTLKGAAASVGLDSIKTTTHTLEDIFRALCAPETSLTPEVEGLIFEAYDCLQLLLSVQLAGARVDEADILDRMAGVVTQLQTHLGDRFGQDGYLPTSTELGFDMTQSIFETGVTQRLDDLATALETPDSESLASLLQSQAEIFIGLAESLNLPGFGEIAQTTLTALSRQPDQVMQIAQIALEDYRSGQALVLTGDRALGGQPSPALKQLATGSAQPQSKSPTRVTKKTKATTTNPATKTQKGAQVATEPGWFGSIWRRLNQTIGTKSPPSNPRSPRKRSPTSTSSTRKTEKASASIRKTEKASAKPSPVPSLDTILGTVETSTSPESFSTTPTTHASTASLPAKDSATSVSASFPERSLKTAEAKSSAPSQKRQPSLPNPQHGTATLRVSVEHLEQINHTVGELLTQQNRQALYSERLATAVKTLLVHIEQQQHQLHKLQNQASQHSVNPISLDLKSVSLPLLNRQFDSLELDHYSELQLLVQTSLEKTVQQAESAEVAEFFIRQTNQILAKQQRLVSNLRETILEVRMQPLGNVFDRFHQALERLTAQYSKPVALKIQGSDVLVDKAIADKLYDPLLHLVRNAFDHGIESPEVRQQQGKSAPAQIQLQASQEGRHLLIRVWDNGRGLDLEAIREKAIDNQLITEETAQTLTPAQTIDLLFEPGFSTADQVDDLSGRGIGLDAVRAQVQALQGKVTVTHRIGQGTCFTLRIPASLVIAKLLLCQAQDKVYTLMTDAVEQILIPRSDQLRTWKGGKALSWQQAGQDRLISVIPLSKALNYNASIPDLAWQEPSPTAAISASNPIILLRYQGHFIGLEVDQLLEEQELFIRPLGPVMAIPNYLYGCTVLANGNLTLVIDSITLTQELLEQSAQSSTEVAEEESVLQHPQDVNTLPSSSVKTSKQSILIVDDSITVRRTLAKTLQQAGYAVLQAKDGADALQHLKRVNVGAILVGAILCDIEMPGMNGFEFLKARQQDETLKKIPTIMLTSRTGAKHQLLAQELGATTYLTKPYLAPQLLETLAEVLESHSQSQLLSTRGDNRG